MGNLTTAFKVEKGRSGELGVDLLIGSLENGNCDDLVNLIQTCHFCGKSYRVMRC